MFDIKKETAFSDLAKEENLKYVDIDKRLYPYFIDVLNDIQKLFTKKGYINANDYNLIFEKFLFENRSQRLKFVIKELQERVLGMYNRKDGEISISNNLFVLNQAQRDAVKSTLCHEFTHFLVDKADKYVKTENGIERLHSKRKDHQINNGGFIDEAYTELFTRTVYPESESYPAQVKMIKFFNYVNQINENLYEFLTGNIPGVDYTNQNLRNFYRDVELYHQENRYKSYSIEKASQDSTYLRAVDSLFLLYKDMVEIEIETYKFKDVMQFVERIRKFDNLIPVKNTKVKSFVVSMVKLFVNTYYANESEKVKAEYFGKIQTLIEDTNLLQNNILKQERIKFGNNDFVFNFHKPAIVLSVRNNLNVEIYRDLLFYDEQEQILGFRDNIQEKMFYASCVKNDKNLDFKVMDDLNNLKDVDFSIDTRKLNIRKIIKEKHTLIKELNEKFTIEHKLFHYIFDKNTEISKLYKLTSDKLEGVKIYASEQNRNLCLWVIDNNNASKLPFNREIKLQLSSGRDLALKAFDTGGEFEYAILDSENNDSFFFEKQSIFETNDKHMEMQKGQKLFLFEKEEDERFF